MTFQGWYSQQDVIEDLMWATGKCVRDIDEPVVVGQKPPRPSNPTCDEDTEMQILRLNGRLSEPPLNSEQMRKPDLAGITEMLRMVDQFSKPASEEPRIRAADVTSEQILSISKLNPKVREFIPKSNCRLDSIKDSKPNKTDSRDNVSNLSPNNRIDKTQLTVKELEDMKEKLKSKINTSNTACVRVKRERNLAIATLLNLYCKPPKTSLTNDDVKPTLITPEYYEKSIDKSNKENVVSNNANDAAECTENVSEHVATSVDKVQKWLSTSANSEKAIKENDNNVCRKVKTQIIESNQKVSPLYLGPVTFKRKAVTKPTSATSSECENAKTFKSNVFVPSAYASELTKTYMERSRLKENIGNDLWKMVEMAIKAKESQKKSENDQVEHSTEERE